MPKDRGFYATVYLVMVDSEEWQRLSRDARDVFYALRFSRENNIIGIFHPNKDALHSRSAVPLEAIGPAIEELERERWVVRHSGFLWIRNQLRFDPGWTPGNEKQAKGLFRHLDGLPQTPIVAAFVRYYQALGYIPADLDGWVPHRRDKKGDLIPDPEQGRQITSATKELLRKFPGATIDGISPYLYPSGGAPEQKPPYTHSVAVSVAVTPTITPSSSSPAGRGSTGQPDPSTRGRAPEEEDGRDQPTTPPDPANGNGPTCPRCGVANTLVREPRTRRDPGWFCRERKGGCGTSLDLGHADVLPQLSDAQRRSVLAELAERYGVDVERDTADAKASDEIKAFFEYDSRTVNDLGESLDAFVQANGGDGDEGDTRASVKRAHELRQRWLQQEGVPEALLVQAIQAAFYARRRREGDRSPP